MYFQRNAKRYLKIYSNEVMYTGFVSEDLADKIDTYVTKNNDDILWVYSEETSGYTPGEYDAIPIPGSDETFQFEHRICSETYGVVDRKAWTEIMVPIMIEYQSIIFLLSITYSDQRSICSLLILGKRLSVIQSC